MTRILFLVALVAAAPAAFAQSAEITGAIQADLPYLRGAGPVPLPAEPPVAQPGAKQLSIMLMDLDARRPGVMPVGKPMPIPAEPEAAK